MLIIANSWECAPKRNPADFILDAAAVSDGQVPLVEKQQDPEGAFKASKMRVDMEAHLNDIPPGFEAPKFDKQYASNFMRQLECNFRREWANVLRRREDLRARFMRSIMLGIILGTVFLQLDHNQAGANDRFGMFFFILIIMGTAANNAVPNVVNGRSVFYREQASGAYRPLAFLISIVVTDIPITLSTCTILTTLVYWLAGLTASASHYFFFVWVVFLYGSLTMAWVIFISLAAPNGEVAQALVGIFTSLFSLYAGFIITRPNIPNYWIWMYYINFFHYPLEAIVSNEMEGNWFGCPNGKGAVDVFIPSANATKQYCPITTGDQMLKGVAFKENFKFADMGITIALWAFVVIMCFIALKFIRHIKR
jgi:ABC-type multidrug transport system permease subunit